MLLAIANIAYAAQIETNGRLDEDVKKDIFQPSSDQLPPSRISDAGSTKPALDLECIDR
ncbi:hypothetical protein [Paraburkholderia sp. SOS3]|jgi:hypothetical protein|uniref:hypothetical protein n=1 Tax=Paraburkholderia sp. SOS3 TaxID=1926494 RepID=UPI0012EC9194|nr:hypothetical protein [Paraburkholderia sp. SOS3]